MSYEQPHCLHCRDTGRTLLDNDQHSDYLDCGHCGAAQERGDMEAYANNLIAINRLPPADSSLLWCIHERARDIAYAEIVRLSKERNQAEARIVSSTDAFKRIAQAHHAALVAGNGDAGEIAKLAAYLGLAPHIDAQAARIAELEAQQAFGIGETYANALSRIAELEAQKDRIFSLACEWKNGIRTGDGLGDALLSVFANTPVASPFDQVLQAPVREVPEGMPVSQEPKYGILDNRLFNRASGEFIPEDEPVFIFRARDWHATGVLMHYKQIGLQQEHWEAVTKRLADFMAFSKDHPERMKEPDTALPAAPVQQEMKP